MPKLALGLGEKLAGFDDGFDALGPRGIDALRPIGGALARY